jgi:hypothetical protein
MRSRGGSRCNCVTLLLALTALAATCFSASAEQGRRPSPAVASGAPYRSVVFDRTRSAVHARPRGGRDAFRWCGTDEVQVDRADAVASNQIHIIYGFPSDGPDRFGAKAPLIVSDLAAIDGWWRQQDPSRTIRFDLATFPNCDSELGRLDLSGVRLPHDAAYYTSQPSPLGLLRDDLASSAIGFSHRYKNYLVYYDGPVSDSNACGRAFLGGDREGGYGVVYLMPPPTLNCLDDLGQGRYKATLSAHEMTHTLGAVLAEAPSRCQVAGHVCGNDRDLMNGTSLPYLPDAILDAGRDDYYGHTGGWLDVQDSQWLRHLDAQIFPLLVSTAGGTGSGRIVSDRPGIDCPPTCSASWEAGNGLVLSAEPEVTSRFDGWTGACTGDADCPVTVDGPRTVGARFTRLVTVKVRVTTRGRSTGTVTSDPEIAGPCADECEGLADQGTSANFLAKPGRGSIFLGWTGSCSGRGTCRITLASDTTVGAAFGLGTFRLTARVAGRGLVRSVPAGIACGSTCSAPFRAYTTVALRAKPAPGWRFRRWGGSCQGTGSCRVVLERDRAVTATFRRL